MLDIYRHMKHILLIVGLALVLIGLTGCATPVVVYGPCPPVMVVHPAPLIWYGPPVFYY